VVVWEKQRWVLFFFFLGFVCFKHSDSCVAGFLSSKPPTTLYVKKEKKNMGETLFGVKNMLMVPDVDRVED